MKRAITGTLVLMVAFSVLSGFTKKPPKHTKSKVQSKHVKKKTPPAPKYMGKLYIPHLAKGKNTSTVPLIVYGHAAHNLARLLSSSSSLYTLVVSNLVQLKVEMQKNTFLGIIAQSRPKYPGEAGKAIQMYRKLSKKRGLLMYYGWSYNVDHVAKLALKYKVDGVLMPGVYVRSIFICVFGALRSVMKSAKVPSSVAEYKAQIKRCAYPAPFWSLQSAPISKFY